MATLNLTFKGESIASSRLITKIKKLEILFEGPESLEFRNRQLYNIEIYDSITHFAKQIKDAIEIASQELAVTYEKLELGIVGKLSKQKRKKRGNQGINELNIGISLLTNASSEELDRLLELAIQIVQFKDTWYENVQVEYNINSIIHLN